MTDIVKHPAHYTGGKIEVWDFIIDQDLTYCRGNVVKYIARAGKKDPAKELEDLEKAKAYLDREIERVTKNIVVENHAKFVAETFIPGIIPTLEPEDAEEAFRLARLRSTHGTGI